MLLTNRLERLERRALADPEDAYNKERLNHLAIRANVANFPFFASDNKIHKITNILKKYTFSLKGNLHYLHLLKTENQSYILLYEKPSSVSRLFHKCQQQISQRDPRQDLYVILQTESGQESHVCLRDLIQVAKSFGLFFDVENLKHNKLSKKEFEDFEISLELYYEMFGIPNARYFERMTPQGIVRYWITEENAFQSKAQAIKSIIIDYIGLDNYAILNLWNKYKDNQTKISLINEEALALFSDRPQFFCEIKENPNNFSKEL